ERPPRLDARPGRRADQGEQGLRPADHAQPRPLADRRSLLRPPPLGLFRRAPAGPGAPARLRYPAAARAPERTMRWSVARGRGFNHRDHREPGEEIFSTECSILSFVSVYSVYSVVKSYSWC